MKKALSLLLAAVMAVSLFAAAGPIALAEDADTAKTLLSTEEVKDQLEMICDGLGGMEQDESIMDWKYAVTDLDHNGRLEAIAATVHPADRSTNILMWEVNEKKDGCYVVEIPLEEDESFPDILSDTVDTYYDAETDTWNYMFYDNVILSADEFYTSKCSVTLKDGKLSYVPYAFEHTENATGFPTVTHMDLNGITISAEEYNAAGVNAFISAEKSNTAFAWFTTPEAADLGIVTDSYAIFNGEKAPEKLQAEPAPAPAASPVPAAPAATPVPVPEAPKYLMITKNPTNESDRKVGSTALFVACANAFDSLGWTLVSPNGGEFTPQNFAYNFPGARISGEYGTTLSIANVAADMNGWGAYCTFYYNGQTARTSTAYLYVRNAPESSTDSQTVIPQPAEPQNQAVEFNLSGTYSNGRGTMYISGTSAMAYVTVTWSSSYAETAEWNFSGSFNFDGDMTYNGAIKSITIYSDDGTTTESITEYTSGSLHYSAAGEYITWSEAPGSTWNRVG